MEVRVVSPADTIARKNEIQGLIASDNIGSGLKLVMDFVRDFSDDNDTLNEIIVISSKYTRVNNDVRKGVLDYEKAEYIRTKLTFSILALVDDVSQAYALNITDYSNG